jgi:hypothetical protein
MSSPLERLQAKLREARDRALVLTYHRHPSKRKLIRLIKSAQLPEAEIVLEAYRRCTRYRPCKMYTCAVCGPKLKAKAKDAALNRIVCRLGRFPIREEVSFVTINGPVVELEVGIAQSALAKFENQLRLFQKRKANGTSWLGYFDISAAGRVHWHGVILHQDMPRSSLQGLLEGSFPAVDQVAISRWRSSHSLAEGMQAVFNYAVVGERHVKVYVRANGPDRDVGLVYDLKAITKRIIVVQALAGRGVQGLRLAINMKARVKGLVVTELETLRRSTRRIRNTKTMLNKPWAPRGIPGTHACVDYSGLTKNRNGIETGEVPKNKGLDMDSTVRVKPVTGGSEE